MCLYPSVLHSLSSVKPQEGKTILFAIGSELSESQGNVAEGRGRQTLVLFGSESSRKIVISRLGAYPPPPSLSETVQSETVTGVVTSSTENPKKAAGLMDCLPQASTGCGEVPRAPAGVAMNRRETETRDVRAEGH